LPIHVGGKPNWDIPLQTPSEKRHFFEMKRLIVALLLAASACGSAGPGPAAGTPLTVPQLKFAVMDSVGPPVYCDPDFYPIVREGGEQENAIAIYPTIKGDTETYAAIVAHEHLPAGDLTDAQKLTVYRAWKLLRAFDLKPSGGDYAFDYRVQPGPTVYQMVAGTVRQNGAVTVSSRTDTTRPPCPICLAASTLIATPIGPVRVTDVHFGTIVWTLGADGSRITAPVVEVGSMEAPIGHRMAHLVLADGRELLVSPGHRTADGRQAGDLHIGDQLDGSTITKLELVPYAGGRTYDLLPAGATGFYWANGILMSSTLSSRDRSR
jgi:hypothetical protein